MSKIKIVPLEQALEAIYEVTDAVAGDTIQILTPKFCQQLMSLIKK